MQAKRPLKTMKCKSIKANMKTGHSEQKGSRYAPEDPGGLFFVIQALPFGGEPFNAMVFATDDQLQALAESHAMTSSHVDKHELVGGLILRDLGLPLDMVIGAKFRLEVFENEAEARAAIAHNRASKADFLRSVNASRN